MLLLKKLIQETQMSKPPKATRHHNLTKSLILLPLRAIYFSTFQYETPCIKKSMDLSYLFQMKMCQEVYDMLRGV